MQMETDSHPSSDSRDMDGALRRLRRDLLDTPPVTPEPDAMTDQADEPDIIDYASVEFEVERMRKRLAVWEIFLDYMRGGAAELVAGAAGDHSGGLRQDHGHLRRRPVAGPAARPPVASPFEGGITRAWPSSDGCSWRRPGVPDTTG